MDGYGIRGRPAPELRVPEWIANVREGDGLRIADIEEPLIYLYAFQSWCPGCHSHGFPTMKAVKEGLQQEGLSAGARFIAVQTVFEGHDVNTADAAREAVERHGLGDIPLGHDSGHPPTLMADYRTGGTPWTIVIGPDRRVLVDGFRIDAGQLLPVFTQLLAAGRRQREETRDGSS